jgi:hypothetical protein
MADDGKSKAREASDPTTPAPLVGAPPTRRSGPRSDELQAAIDRALPLLLGDEFTWHSKWLTLSIIARRFHVAALHDVGTRWLESIADPPTVTQQALGRIVGVDRTVDAAVIDQLTGVLNPMTARALHCQTLPLDERYASALDAGLAQGEYGATHVVLADSWRRCLGCASPSNADAVVKRAKRAVEKLARDRDGKPSDLEMEAAMVLHLVDPSRARERVQESFVDSVLAAQREDGGWSRIPAEGESDWHSTAIAVWLLHERLYDAVRSCGIPGERPAALDPATP